MAKYHAQCLAELAHQLKISPVRLRLRQLDAVENLADFVEPDKNYPYDFIYHRITGFRPRGHSTHKAILGKALVEDLAQLAEDLSSSPALPVELPGAWQTTEEVSERLKVSTKTICRWRRRGLIGRKLRYPDGTIRMAFSERSIRRFVSRHIDLVKRGAAFTQLTDDEKQCIVDLAREALAERRMRLHELSQVIAAKVGRAVETVRYTLRRYDQSNPQTALFGQDDQPIIEPALQAIYDAVRSGQSVQAVAAEFRRSKASVEAVVREVRARILLAADVRFIHNQEFETPGADQVILQSSGDEEDIEPRRVRPPRDLPPYLQELYRQPLLTPQQERAFFRRYNYLKFKADRLRKAIDPLTVTDEQLDAVDALLKDAEAVKNDILRANLRLVVSIARRHVGRAACFFETVSDGNLSLMRAVEKFDYARGFKFSTYASWAIMRNYARTVPEQMYQSARMVTGVDEALASAPAANDTARDSIIEAARHLLHKGFVYLTARERHVLTCHYGLNEGAEPMTLDQIGKEFGVTKERVRQIERKAFTKLRSALGEQDGDEQLQPA